MADFEHSLEEVKPAFGNNAESLQAYAMHGIINYGDVFDHLQQTLKALVQQVGPAGCGALGIHVVSEV